MALEDKYMICILQPFNPPTLILKRTEHGSYSYLEESILSDNVVCKNNISYVCNNINVIIQNYFTDYPTTTYLVLDDKYYYKGTIVYQKLTDIMKIFIDSFAPFIISHQQCIDYNYNFNIKK